MENQHLTQHHFNGSTCSDQTCLRQEYRLGSGKQAWNQMAVFHLCPRGARKEAPAVAEGAKRLARGFARVRASCTFANCHHVAMGQGAAVHKPYALSFRQGSRTDRGTLSGRDIRARAHTGESIAAPVEATASKLNPECEAVTATRDMSTEGVNHSVLT